MKINSKLLSNPIYKLFSFFSFCIVLGASQLNASSFWDDYLANVEQRFDAAGSPADKYSIISEPLNLEYLYSASWEGIAPAALDLTKLHKDVNRGDMIKVTTDQRLVCQFRKTHPLALTISCGKSALLAKFLKVVPHDNLKDLMTWGYRQPYNMAHLALDPSYPSIAGIADTARLEIIDLLSHKHINWNYIYPANQLGVYENPPLSAGEPSGRCSGNRAQLRASAILRGADPYKKGSSFGGLYLSENSEVIKSSLDQYLETKGTGMKPTEEVRKLLRAEREARIARLKAVEI